MKKKLLSLLLALCLVMALVPMTAFAAETMDTWDGTADTSWYDENKTEFHLQTAEQLAGMAKLVNDNTANFKDKTVYLDNDLDLGGHEWISIGDGANTAGGSFQGVFDGQSHVVYNLYSHEGLKSISPPILTCRPKTSSNTTVHDSRLSFAFGIQSSLPDSMIAKQET